MLCTRRRAPNCYGSDVVTGAGGLSLFLLSLVSAACFAVGWLSFRGRLSTGLAVMCAFFTSTSATSQ